MIQVIESRVLHKGAWVAVVLGTLLLKDYKKVQISIHNIVYNGTKMEKYVETRCYEAVSSFFGNIRRG